MENIKLQNMPQSEAFQDSSKIITQEMVEGEYAGKAERVLRRVFRWLVKEKVKS